LGAGGPPSFPPIRSGAAHFESIASQYFGSQPPMQEIEQVIWRAGGRPRAAFRACCRAGDLGRFFRDEKTSPSIRVRHAMHSSASLAPQKRKNLAKRRGSFLGAGGLELPKTEVGGFTDEGNTISANGYLQLSI